MIELLENLIAELARRWCSFLMWLGVIPDIVLFEDD